MKFTPIALAAATAAAILPSTSGYSIIRNPQRPLYRFAVPSVRSYVRALDRVLDDQVALFDRQIATIDRQWDEMEASLQRYSPRVDVANQADKFQVSVDVPGFKKDDINVELVGDGTVLSISGTRKSDESSGRRFSTVFRQSFSLSPTVNVDEIVADLSDGVLTVSAPKEALIENKNRKIPLTMGSSVDSGEKAVEKAEESDTETVDTDGAEGEKEEDTHGADEGEESKDSDVVDLDKEEE